MIELNLNDSVQVKLTEEGLSIYNKHYGDFSYDHQIPVDSLKPKLRPDKDGRCTFQLWDLMCIFGPHMRMGFHLPFEGNQIYLPESSV